MTRLRQIWLYLLGLPKTVFFNFWYLPLSQAIRLPVLVSHRVWLMHLGGHLTLDECRFGCIQIGFGSVGIFDQHRSRSIWQVSGTVRFRGDAQFGHGSKISVSGELDIGRGFRLTAESAIVAHKQVHIGEGVLVSWDVLIVDTDFHAITDAEGRTLNPPAPIWIGNSVWIGCRTLVLKGVRIADGVVVAAATTVSRSVDEPCAIAAGAPAEAIRKDIRWTM